MNTANFYSTRLFLYAVIPVMKEINREYGYFGNRNCKVQISVQTPEGLLGTHFVVEDGSMNTVLSCTEDADVVLHFPNEEHFISFFKGKSKKLPKIKGLSKPGELVATFRTLLKMSSLLGAKEPPKDEATKALVVKLFFYLLSTGISQLNKLGHEDVVKWTSKSPNRVYGWSVDGYEEAGAYLRVKAGKTKAARGLYTRSQPFFTMRFADLDSALAILLSTGDLLQLTAEKKLIMEGAPEYGAQIGDYMMLVGAYVQ